MTNSSSVGPKDFFLWLAATAALYVSVISLLALWFEFIDRLWGTADPYAYVDPFSAGIRIAVASLIVIFPLYVWFMRMLHNDIRSHGEKRELWVRRWLLVLTLFIAGVTVVVDLIVLINAFLGGEELTFAFVLKVLAVLVVVGGAFVYYLHEIRGTWDRKEQTSKLIAGGVSLVVLASVIASFFFIGSPASQRALRYDQQRLNDLQSIQWQITDYWQQKQELPNSLEDLKDPLKGTYVPEDPETEDGKAYEYVKGGVTPKGVATFELCATFSLPSREEQSRAMPMYMGTDSDYWMHDEGRVCFNRTIDPDKFPPYTKM